MLRTFLSLLVMGACVTACAAPGDRQNQGDGKSQNTTTSSSATTGAGIDKGMGRFEAAAEDTLLGAALGSSIGASLDRVDMMYYNQTSQHALETAKDGATIAWSNPDSGNSGTVTPLNVMERKVGQFCREYRQTIKVGGKIEEGYGTACRHQGGTWKISK